MRGPTPEFYKYNQEWIDTYINIATKTAPSDLLLEEVEKMGVYTNIFFVPVFSQLFCDEMVSIAKNIPNERWTQNRHPSYPTTDIILKDVGLEDVYNEALKNFMIPLAIDAYELVGTVPDDYFSENFLVRYTPDTQNHLTTHNDSSMFTFNISLNSEFDGGGIIFKKNNIHVQPNPGSAVLAPGMLGYKHGAKPITAGERYMIISFVMPKKPFFRENTL